MQRTKQNARETEKSIKRGRAATKKSIKTTATSANFAGVKPHLDKNTIIYGSTIGIKTRKKAEVIKLLKTGLHVSTFKKLQSELDVSVKTLSSVVNIPPRTLSRRKKEGRLHTDESERVLRIARVYDRAVEVFNKTDRVKQWFKTPNKALGDKSPLEFADTEPGAREVEDLLGRIEHGVYS